MLLMLSPSNTPVTDEKSVTIKERDVVATSYCLKGKMANGQRTRQGVIAADPRVFPLGTKLLIGGKQYIVADTGGAIRGNRVDIWLPSCSEAKKFGRRTLKVQLI